MRRHLLGLVLPTLLPVLLPVDAAGAHELESNRLTLVQRDDRHLALTLYFDAGAALQRAIAPGMRYDEFAATHAAMAPEAFARAAGRATQGWQGRIRLRGADAGDGGALALQGWAWPPAAQLQAALQRHVMRSLTGGAEHDHEQPAVARAEAAGNAVPRRLVVELPAALQPVLVVAYRPRQAWSRAGSRPVEVELP